ncbi:hypothetical protein [Pediococcus pentosaceus]|uniref:hypothetical protein n=1 Tax=Pediococcus pentosaceus TaxID=1255 RepID=UPI001F5A1AAA|nr:hypothetical protein [Pediococcus pentosaceus]MCI2961055.1 hypothetical protein [Pediococcus pentosaceus]
MKRLYTVTIAILALVTLTACGSKKDDTKKVAQKFYTVKITDTRTKDDDWIIKGTTNAPDGSQVVAITDDSDSQMLENSSVETPTVKHGKFAATVDGILPDDDSKAGDKNYIYITASSPNKVATSDDTSVKKKYISDVQQDKFEQTLKFSQGQIDYYKSLDDDDSSSSESSSDSTSSSESKAPKQKYESSSNDSIKNISDVISVKNQSDRLFVKVDSASFDEDFIPTAVKVLKKAKDSGAKYTVIEGTDEYTTNNGDVKTKMSRLTVFENNSLDLKNIEKTSNFYKSAKEYMFNPSDYSREQERNEGKSDDFNANGIKDHKYDASSANSSILVDYYSKQMGDI